MDLFEGMLQKDRDEFRRVCNKLMSICFIVRRNEATKSDYYFILRMKDVFARYLDILGYMLEINEEYGVIQLVNRENYNHLNLKLYDSIILLLLRILYDEKKREFSVAFFKDSKAAAGEIAGAAGIITQFSEDPVFCGLTTEQVLEECNIYPNPSWIYVKGRGTFLAGASRIELSSFPSGIGLSGKDIKNVCWNEENPPEKVVTIENLTSFHRWQDASSLAVYLGGYHNRAKRLFLKSIYEAYSDALYCHFGDLDCGGFLIFKDLSEKTGIPFLTVKMDEETYLNYLDSGRELTSHDRRELLRMMEDPFFVNQRGLFKRMLKEGKKLEQECIRL